jgi:hypothetical protein
MFLHFDWFTEGIEVRSTSHDSSIGEIFEGKCGDPRVLAAIRIRPLVITRRASERPTTPQNNNKQ